MGIYKPKTPAQGMPCSTQGFSVHQSSLGMEGTSQSRWCWTSDTGQIKQHLQHNMLNEVIFNEIKAEASKVTPCSFSPSSP